MDELMDEASFVCSCLERVFAGFRVLGFDLETTGFDMRKERIVEYALVGSDIDGSHINLQSLVNPGKRIPVDSTNVHGIKNSDVKNSGEFSQHISVSYTHLRAHET